MRVKLSIIILNWNSGDDLTACLASIADNTGIKNKEIIVVDNGSTDGSELAAMRKHPEIHLVKNSKNLGVSMARNQGLEISRGEYALILDVDTEVKPGAIDQLVADMEKHPEVGLAGAKLVFHDGSLQYSCREFPTIVSKLLFRRLPSLFGRFLRKEEYLDWNHNRPAYVGYVIGACQIIRRKCLEELGFLDERIFYGPEDIDYCLRAWKAGWKVMYNPQSVIVHKEARITKGGLLKQIRNPIFWTHIKGLLIFFRTHRYLFRRPGPFFQELTS